MSAIQHRPNELVDVLRPDFQHRNEPNFAWKSAVSATLGMPGLVAVWPMSVVRRDSATDRARDVGGGAYHLTDNNGVQFGYAGSSLIPVAEFPGTNEYLSRVDGGAADWADITGTETHVRTVQRGLTIGGWFYLEDVTTDACLMGKWDGAGVDQRSYMLWLDGATSNLQFFVSSAGTAVSVASVTGAVAVINNWHYVVGSFDNTGNTIDIRVNSATASAAYANTIFDSDSSFTIGATDSPGSYLDALVTLCFLSQCAASSSQTLNHFQQTRVMFGV
jgi:hypothetical protein